MVRQLTVNATDRLGAIRQGSIRVGAAAHQAQTADGGWDLDDDAAALLFPGLKVARLTDDASGATKHIWRGRIWVKGLSRGDSYMGDARQFGVNVVDSNWDLTKLRVHAWSRPAETDVARVQAVRAYILNGSSSTVTNARKRASTVIGATTYVPNTNTVTMPARVYDASDPWLVIDDCARAAGKAYFVIVNDDGTLDLFYDLPTSVAYASTLSITDSNPDLSTSFPPIHDGGAGTQDPSELLSGAGLVYADGSVVTGFDSAVESAHDVAEATVYDQGAVSSAGATARLAVIRAQRGVEEARYRCSISLPPAKAHLLKAGMTLSYRDAAAGVTSPITVRASRVEHEIDAPDMYRVHCELNFPEKIAPRLVDVGRPIIPRLVSGAASDDWELTIVYTTPDLETQIGILAGMLGKNACYFFTTNTVPPFLRLHWCLSTQTPEPSGNYFAVGGEVPIGTPFTIVMGVNGGNCYAKVNGGTLVKPAGSMGALSSRIVVGISTTRSGSPAAWQGFVESIASGAGMIDDFQRVVDPQDAASGWGAASGGGSWVNGPGGAPFMSSVNGSQGKMISGGPGDLRLPITQFTGQLTVTPGAAYYGEVYGAIDVAIADGLVSSWTLPYPTVYVPGSLVVWVDGVRQTAIETSPSTGGFALPWTPGLGDEIAAQWRVPAVV